MGSCQSRSDRARAGHARTTVTSAIHLGVLHRKDRAVAGATPNRRHRAWRRVQMRHCNLTCCCGISRPGQPGRQQGLPTLIGWRSARNPRGDPPVRAVAARVAARHNAAAPGRTPRSTPVGAPLLDQLCRQGVQTRQPGVREEPLGGEEAGREITLALRVRQHARWIGKDRFRRHAMQPSSRSRSVTASTDTSLDVNASPMPRTSTKFRAPSRTFLSRRM